MYQFNEAFENQALLHKGCCLGASLVALALLSSRLRVSSNCLPLTAAKSNEVNRLLGQWQMLKFFSNTIYYAVYHILSVFNTIIAKGCRKMLLRTFKRFLKRWLTLSAGGIYRISFALLLSDS